jgi:hypothetical protein
VVGKRKGGGEAYVDEPLDVRIHCGLEVTTDGTAGHCGTPREEIRGGNWYRYREKRRHVRESEEALRRAGEESGQLRSGVEPEHQSHNDIPTFTSA